MTPDNQHLYDLIDSAFVSITNKVVQFMPWTVDEKTPLLAVLVPLRTLSQTLQQKLQEDEMQSTPDQLDQCQQAVQSIKDSTRNSLLDAMKAQHTFVEQCLGEEVDV